MKEQDGSALPLSRRSSPKCVDSLSGLAAAVIVRESRFAPNAIALRENYLRSIEPTPTEA